MLSGEMLNVSGPYQKIPVSGFGRVEIEGKNLKEEENNFGFLPSDVVSLKNAYPFRFLVPENCVPGVCRWIYPVTFGGGLVAGDHIMATVKVGSGCAAVVSSQESNKVYHCNTGHETRQDMIYIVEKCGLLCVLPDPLVCYRNANFTQKQVIHIKASSNLVFLDWMLSGRLAMDEVWAFKRYRNRIEVWLEEEVVMRENTELEDTSLITVAESMKDKHVCGTCIILGPQLIFLVDNLQAKYSRKRDLGEQPSRDIAVSWSPVAFHSIQGETICGGYLRFLARDMTAATPVIEDIIKPLIPILGADPFERKL